MWKCEKCGECENVGNVGNVKITFKTFINYFIPRYSLSTHFFELIIIFEMILINSSDEFFKPVFTG
jgi:hypothetical protein